MWEDQPRRHHHHHDERKSNKSIQIAFYIFHVICILLGIGLFLIAHFVQKVEKNTMGNIELGITQAMSTVYNISGAALFVAVIIGLVAQFIQKSFVWLVYCILLTMICMTQFSATGTTFGSMSTHESVIHSLKDLMKDYGKTNNEANIQMTLAWDALQQKYECCGVDNYTDWQRVEFGLTSLKVPLSCCLKVKWSHVKEIPKNCGQNMLPDHEKAYEFIFVKGCLKEIMKDLDMQRFIMGVFGLVVAVMTINMVFFSCFLVITKRV